MHINNVLILQLDEARPELPLTDKNQENYPVGICIDTAAVHQLPWGWLTQTSFTYILKYKGFFKTSAFLVLCFLNYSEHDFHLLIYFL